MLTGIIYPRHRLDLGAGDVVAGLIGCLRRADREVLTAAVLAEAGLAGRGLVTLSVRSGWDLVLALMDWPAGSEVIVSGISHPDMVELIRAHGLVAVPVDLDLATMAPAVSELERALSPRTRAVLLVHLFGGRVDQAPIADYCRRHGLLLVEDRAQAYAGTATLDTGAAAVSLTSFGLIKTATAVGGGIVAVADPELLARMEREHASWPVQRSSEYALRLLRAGLLASFNDPRRFAVLHALCRALRIDIDQVLTRSTRSFGGSADALRRRIRRQPSAALLRLLRRRLRGFDQARLRARSDFGERLTAELPAGLRHPGDALLSRTHWVYPVLAANPGALSRALSERGIDISRSTSNLVAVADHAGRIPPGVSRLMAAVSYLPNYPELGRDGRDRLLAGLRHASVTDRRVGDAARGASGDVG